MLAHELAHARNRDVSPQTAAVVLAAALVEVTRLGGLMQRTLLFVLGPVASATVHVLLSPRRELLADRRAAEICESPHGLANALIRLEQTAELVEVQASPATAPLYTVNPFPEHGLPASSPRTLRRPSGSRGCARSTRAGRRLRAATKRTWPETRPAGRSRVRPSRPSSQGCPAAVAGAIRATVPV